MTTVQPVTDQPEQVPMQVTPVIAIQPPGNSAWGSGLCGCCSDISSCCLGMFCPQILACLVSSKMDECCCTGCLGLVALRTKYRVQQGIQGTVCKDCLACCACCPCVLCQLSRELKRNSP